MEKTNLEEMFDGDAVALLPNNYFQNFKFSAYSNMINGLCDDIYVKPTKLGISIYKKEDVYFVVFGSELNANRFMNYINKGKLKFKAEPACKIVMSDIKTIKRLK